MAKLGTDLNIRTLTLTKIHNPFDRRNRDDIIYEYRGEPLSLIRKTLPLDVEFITSINGQVITDLELVVPQPGDHVVFYPVPYGGNDGKMVGRIAMMVGFAALGMWAGPALAGAMGLTQTINGITSLTFAGSLVAATVGAAAMIVGGLLINALFPTKTNPPTQAYSWTPQTLQQQGIPLAKYYGTNKLRGNIISGYVNTNSNDNNQTIYALISLGMGPISLNTPDKIQLNDQPYSNYTVSKPIVQVRRGDLNQTVISGFETVTAEHITNVEISFNNDPYVYVTPGDSFDQLMVQITFSQGLFSSGSNGGIDCNSVDLRIEIQKVGESTWTNITQTPDVPTAAIGDRWSKGYWAGGGAGDYYWIETEEGSTNTSDHYESEPAGLLSSGAGDFNLVWHWVLNTDIIIITTLDYITVKNNVATSISYTYYSQTNLPHGQYNVRLTRLTPDSNNIASPSAMYLTDVREITNSTLTYPRQALVGIQALATNQLSGGLNFSMIADCAIVRVYNGTTWGLGKSRAGNGSDDFGSFNNPAWVLWDILTQPVFDNNLNVLRYDGVNPSYLDLPAFYELAQWCDTLVSDGKDGTEKRITFNGGFDAESTLWDCALQVCQVAGCSIVPTGYGYTLAIDKPTTATQLFNMGNITVDSFKETFLPLEDRAAEIQIDYLDKDQNYLRTSINVVNPNIKTIANKVSLVGAGITSYNEAWRIANKQLLNNELIVRTIEFGADIDSIVCTVGDVINFQHDVPQWGFGGRVISATSTTVTLDQEVTLESATTYSLMIRHEDDSLETRTVTTGAGITNILTISSAFTTIPVQFELYAFGVTGVVTKPFRVTSIQPDSELQATIAAIEYNEAIYDDSGIVAAPTTNYSALPTFVEVNNITLVEQSAVDENNNVKRNITVTWDITNNSSSIFDHCDIYIAPEGAPYSLAGSSKNNNFTIQNVQPITAYTVVVVGVAYGGLAVPFIQAPSANITTSAKTGASNTQLLTGVNGLQIFGQGNNTSFVGKDVHFIWNKLAAVDITYPAGQEPNGAGSSNPNPLFRDYEVKIYDTNNVLKRTEYIGSEEYFYTYQKNYDDNSGLPLRSFTIQVKARDIYYNVSQKAATLTVSNPAPDVVTNIQLWTGIQTFTVDFQPSTLPDVAYYIVWASTTSGFTPAENLVINRGADTHVVAKGVAGTTYYVKIAAVDTFGETSLVYSSEYSVAVLGQLVNSADLADASVITAKLADVAITTGKLADSAVTNQKLVDAAITAAKIASGAVDATKTTIAAINNVTGNLNSGTVDAAQLVANAVTSTTIAAAAITAAKTSLAAIDSTSGNLTANSVTAYNIAAGTITSTQIATDTIVAGNIAASAIGTSELAAGAVTAAAIAAGTITSTQIATDTILAGNIAANAVTSSELNTGAVTAGKIAASALVVSDGVMQNGYITTALIGDAQVLTAKIADGAITNAKIGSLAVNTANIANAAIGTIQIADAAITTAKILDANITGAKIASATITDANIGSLNAAKVLFTDTTNGYIALGKTSATDDTNSGFWLGNVSGTAKFKIGNSSNNMTWDGTTLAFTGKINGTRQIIGSVDSVGLSSNLSSIATYTRLGTGTYKITFASAFTVNPFVVATTQYTGGAWIAKCVDLHSVGSDYITLQVFDTTGAAVDGTVNFIVFCDY